MTDKIADAYFLCESREEADELMKKANRYAEKNGYIIEGKYFSKGNENVNLTDKVISSLSARKVKLLILSDRQALGSDEMLRRERRNNIRKAGVKIMFLKGGYEPFYALYWLNTVKNYNSYALDWKIRIGAIEKPAPHKITNGTVPYGYDSENGYYKINEAQAKNIRLIFDLYSSGLSVSAIIKKLRETGCERRFPVSSIMSMLQNEHYAGIDRGEAGTVPAIVTNRQFLTAKGRIEKHRRNESIAYPFLFDNVNFTVGKTKLKLKPDKGAGCSAKPVYYGQNGNIRVSADAEKLESAVTDKLFENLSKDMNAEGEAVLTFAQAKETETLQYADEAKKQKGILEAKFSAVFGSDWQNIKRGNIREFDKLKAALDEINKKLHRAEIISELCAQSKESIEYFFENMKRLPDMQRSEARFFVNRLISRINANDDKIIIDCNYNEGQRLVVSDAREYFKISEAKPYER